MPVFSRGKTKLVKAIREASASSDRDAFDRVYQLFAKQVYPASKLFEFILGEIEPKERQESHLRSLRAIGNSSSSSSDINGEFSASNPVTQPLGLLRVFQGIVWSFPSELGKIFSEKATGAKLVKAISSSSNIHVEVRQALFTLVSRWCILYSKSPKPRSILENVVDVSSQKTSFTPKLEHLPFLPVVYIREGWEYPHSEFTVHGPQFFYSISNIDLVPHAPATERRHHPNGQQPSLPPPPPPNGISAQNPLPPVDEQQQELTPDFIEHMERCAKELINLSEMATENIISLNVDENPANNAVVDDMFNGLKLRRDKVAAYINMLKAEHPLTLQKLKHSLDESDRTVETFNKAIRSHEEWEREMKALHDERVSLHTNRGTRMSPPIESSSYGAAAGCSSSSRPMASSAPSPSLPVLQSEPESSKTAARAIAAASSKANAHPLPPASSESSSSTAQTPKLEVPDNAITAISQPPSMGRMSSKARGKMPDLGGPEQSEAALPPFPPPLPPKPYAVAAGASSSSPSSNLN